MFAHTPKLANLHALFYLVASWWLVFGNSVYVFKSA